MKIKYIKNIKKYDRKRVGFPSSPYMNAVDTRIKSIKQSNIKNKYKWSKFY